MSVMEISVTVVSYIFIPPYFFGVYAVVGECVARNYRPAGERAEFEIAVGYLVLARCDSLLNVIFILYKERALFLRLGIFAEANVVYRKIAVIPALVVVHYPYISLFSGIVGQIYIVFIEVIRVVNAGGVSCRIDVIFGMLVEIIVVLYRYELVVGNGVNAEIA